MSENKKSSESILDKIKHWRDDVRAAREERLQERQAAKVQLAETKKIKLEERTINRLCASVDYEFDKLQKYFGNMQYAHNNVINPPGAVQRALDGDINYRDLYDANKNAIKPKTEYINNHIIKELEKFPGSKKAQDMLKNLRTDMANFEKDVKSFEAKNPMPAVEARVSMKNR